MNSQGQLSFGPFRLDSAAGQLLHGRRAVHVTPKALAVLEFLVKNPGRLVAKEELLRAVWADTFATDASLKVCVREIRKALQDSPDKPRYIETAHRRGYRFIARVQTTPAGEETEEKRNDDAPAEDAASPVGREAELRSLQSRLEAARRGQRQVVFVTGEAGSGKSTLLEAFLTGAVRQGVRVAAGQCFEHFGRGEAYLPLWEALGRLEQELGRDVLADLLRKHAPAWLAQTDRQAAAEGRHVEPLGATAERVLRELAEVLEALTAQAPLVLVLEDLHWSDYSTLDLISALARRRTPARLLLVATYRPVDVILGEHPLRAVKQELLAHHLCAELPLPPLDEAAVAEYLRQRFPGRAPAADLARQLHERTDGLPLFLVNLVDYLLGQHVLLVTDEALRLTEDLGRVELEVPEGVRPLIEKQIDRLTADERRLLEGASVAGLEFAAAALAAALELDVVAVEESCEALAQRQLFLEARDVSEWPDGTVSTRYRFRHDLYHAAFYRRVSAARRGRLHQRLGERLETAHRGCEEKIAAELALHFEQGRDHVRAVCYLKQAARRAECRHANREALDYLQRALDQTARLPPVDQELERSRLLQQRGKVRRASNDMAGATADFEALLAFARQQQRTDEEAAALTNLVSVVSWVNRERCLRVADELDEISGRLGDPLLQAHARGQAGFFRLLMRGWVAEDVRAVAAAAAAARGAGDDSRLYAHLRQFSFLQSLQSEYAVAAASAEEAARLALAHDDAAEYLVSRFFQAWAQLHQGRWGPTLHVLQEAKRIAKENGHRRWVVMFRYGLAWLHLQVYDFERARGLIEHSLQEVKLHEFPYGQLIGPILLGYAHMGLGDLDAAGVCFDGMAARLGQERLILDWVWWMLLHLGRTEYWLKRKDYGRARAEAEQLCAVAGKPGERTYQALGLRSRAVVAMAHQDWKAAEADLAQAAAFVEGIEAPLAAAPVHATLARLHRCRNRRRAADQAQARSEAVCAALAQSLGEEAPLSKSFVSGRSVLEY